MNRRKVRKSLTFLLIMLLAVSLNVQIRLSGGLSDISLEFGTKVYAFDPALEPNPISAGILHTVALVGTTTKVWGDNSCSELGLGENNYGKTRNYPANVGLSAKSVAAGRVHTIAVSTGGKLYGWGCNEYCQLGLGDEKLEDIHYKEQITGTNDEYWKEYGFQYIGNKTFVQVAAGSDHSLALDSSGYVWGMGINTYGQLGTGYDYDGIWPLKVYGIKNIKQIAAGDYFSAALGTNGSVYVWGNIGYGYYTPECVYDLPAIKQISAGIGGHLAMLDYNGRVWTMGYNSYGQLGLGDSYYRDEPEMVQGLPTIVQVAAGDCHTMALTTNGTVYVWGDNSYGQLGLGSNIYEEYEPTRLNLTGVRQLAAGGYSSFAIMNDGSVYAWGWNEYGQLGVGDYVDNYYVPKLTKLAYSFNNAPVIDAVLSPLANQMYKKDATIIPQIKVHDLDGNNLNMYCKIDGTVKSSLVNQTNTTTAKDYTFPSIPANDLSDGTHTMTFEVSDTAGAAATQAVTIKVDKTAPVIGTVSCTPTHNSMMVAGTASDASTGLDAAPYRYTVAGGSVNYQKGWTADTSYTTPAGLAPNTSYTVTFEAKDKAGNIAVKQQSVYTNAQTPTLAVSSPTTGSLVVSTTDSNPASTQYQIMTGGKYVTAAGSLTTTETWMTLTNKQITVTGLNNNTQYSFTARARNTALVQTTASAAASGITLPNPPGGLKGTPGINQVKLSWNAITGATGYDIYADGAVISNITTNTYTHSGLGAESSHTYMVRARNGGGTGPWSSAITVTTLPNPPEIPTGLKAKEVNILDITMEWNAVARAESYELKINSGTMTNTIKGLTGTIYKFTGLVPDTEYTVLVQAVNKGGSSGFSSGIKVRTLPNIPDTPAGLKAEPMTYAMKLTWNASARAEYYEVWVNNAFLTNTKEPAYLHEGLSPVTKYSYKVRAWNAGGTSIGWAQLEATTLPMKPDTPTNVTAVAESTSVFISWDMADRAESYKLRIDGNDSGIISGITITGYTHKGLTPGTQHSYEVLAVNAGGESSWSSIVKISTLPEAAVAITNVAAVVKSTSIILSWDTVGAGVEYEVEADGNIVKNGANTIYKHSSLIPVSQHNYKIRPVKDGVQGKWCAVITLFTLPNPPEAPKNITATVTNTTVQLTWEAVADATGYDIEIDDGIKLETVTGSSFTHEGLTPGTQHSYRIRAKNIGGVTAWSEKITESTINPSYILEARAGEEYHLVLTASGIQDFNGVKFIATYNPAEMDIIDLCEATPELDIVENGRIPDTGLSVIYSAGRIELTMDNPIMPGKAWSGAISTIVFKAKITGQIIINYAVQ